MLHLQPLSSSSCGRGEGRGTGIKQYVERLTIDRQADAWHASSFLAALIHHETQLCRMHARPSLPVAGLQPQLLLWVIKRPSKVGEITRTEAAVLTSNWLIPIQG